MKNLYFLYTVMLLILLGSCSDYDDSSIKNEIDGYKQRIAAIQAKVELLNKDVSNLAYLTNGNVITSVTQNSDGKYVIIYKDSNDEEKAVIVATSDDVIELPILGVRLSEDDKLYYWTITVDAETDWLYDEQKAKIPVSGHTPKISVDSDGYWVVNGTILIDSMGNPIEATTDETAIFKDITKTENGYLQITLGNGEKLTLEVFNAINLVLKSSAVVQVTDLAAPLTIEYDVTGSAAEQAIISIAQENNVKATINKNNKTITLSFEAGFTEGHIIVTAYDLEHLVLRPLLFKHN